MVNSIESIQRDVKLDVVFSRIKDGDLSTLDYMRLADDGNMSYHQMAFALAGQPGETENFILAFRDIDRSIRKHISDKRYLREQLDIVETLSRDYYNIFKITPQTGGVVILKKDQRKFVDLHCTLITFRSPRRSQYPLCPIAVSSSSALCVCPCLPSLIT